MMFGVNLAATTCTRAGVGIGRLTFEPACRIVCRGIKYHLLEDLVSKLPIAGCFEVFLIVYSDFQDSPTLHRLCLFETA